jgi:hypothetical protein
MLREEPSCDKSFWQHLGALRRYLVNNPSAPAWRLWVSAFILIHLCILFLWNLPSSHMRSALIRGPVMKYMYATGVRQWWGMFTVGGSAINYHLEAEIFFQDGSKKVWILPRMDELSVLERTQQMMHGTWKAYILSHKEAWQETANYIARLHNDDPANPPQRVDLMKHWAPTLPPAPYRPVQFQKEFPNKTVVFSMTIDPQDL